MMFELQMQKSSLLYHYQSSYSKLSALSLAHLIHMAAETGAILQLGERNRVHPCLAPQNHFWINGNCWTKGGPSFLELVRLKYIMWTLRLLDPHLLHGEATKNCDNSNGIHSSFIIHHHFYTSNSARYISLYIIIYHHTWHIEITRDTQIVISYMCVITIYCHMIYYYYISNDHHYHYILVGGLEQVLFSIIYGIILPIDEYFPRWLKPPTSISYNHYMYPLVI